MTKKKIRIMFRMGLSKQEKDKDNKDKDNEEKDNDKKENSGWV